MHTDEYGELVTALTFTGLDTEPKSPERLGMLKRIRIAFSVLTGRFGGRQVPLACTSGGALQVNDTVAQASLLLINTDTAAMAFDSYALNVLVTAGNASLATIATKVNETNNNIAALKLAFDDVHDAANNYLRTHETA